MVFNHIFHRTDPIMTPVEVVYDSLIKKSRETIFYRDYGVPDTIDGRFDMIIIHAMLVFRRLRSRGEQAEIMSQNIFDLMFQDMDRSLREMGVGDLSVSKQIKKMAKAFYGRASMYEEGLDGSNHTLAEALIANVYRSSPVEENEIKAFTEYLRGIDAYLKKQSVEHILMGHIDFRM
ncbi:MAG: hypothetical protein CMG46_10525 [Candidatus Marinimicrobia bacterium]|nr:hypothetical protein [Candidatus Neomarinimicrobiota bacterium]